MARRDSKLWEEAVKASKGIAYPKKYKVKQKKQPQIPEFGVESMVLKHEYQDILGKIQVLNKRRQYIRRVLESRNDSPIVRKGYFEKPIFLYALRLEGGHYYIGMSRNVDKRFTKHKKGKGSIWSKEFAPIEILEIRQTGSNDDSKVGLLEDDMTIEYAMKFGSRWVHGGGYCQRKPRWPAVVVQNELPS